MGIVELILVALALSMDAFAVALSDGLSLKGRRRALLIAGLFGFFQALMPLIGWLLGTQFEKYITEFDHWIAFGLLLFIGGKMIWEAVRGGEEDEDDGKFDIKELFLMAIATSIDALAVGITFAFLNVNIWVAAAFIGVTTFLLSATGVKIGHVFGEKYKSKAELAGGVILMLMGLKILLEHLGYINF